MTQPDDWTQDHTDALGDVAWDKIIAEIDAAEADARECRAERASYGDAMTEKLAAVEADRNALRKQLALVILDYQDRLAGAFMDTGQVVMERDALRDEAAELQAERDEIIEALDEYGWWMDNTDMLQRLKFALAVSQEKSDDLANMQLAARECRAERARYGDAMTERLVDAESERDALRAALQSLIDGRDEYEIEYFTGMDTAEAREIINLAYNRK